MENLLLFLLKSSTSLILFYAGYLLIFRNSAQFRQQRFYLWMGIIFSLLLPFNQYSLRSQSVLSNQNQEVIIPAVQSDPLAQIVTPEISATQNPAESITGINYWYYIQIVYLMILVILLFRFSLGLMRFVYIYAKSGAQIIQGKKVYLTPRVDGSTSFFGILFLHPDLKDHPHLSKIISHENIHASQYHTMDVLIIELLAAAMWFNPVVWLLRRSLQQLHEYLADEGVINSGFNRFEYQQLLVDHIAEETLLLTSGFQSSIKKRMIMMTKKQTQTNTTWKLWLLLPLIGGIFIAISCMNKPGADNESVVSAVAPTKMNVLYLGVDNPINIAVAGFKPDEIKAVTDNGNLIPKQDGYYVAQPKKIGSAVISLFHKDKKIGEYQFRIKMVPDPVARFHGKKGGEISKAELLDTNSLEVIMENFDFDLSFKITSFTVSCTVQGFAKEERSNSSQLTPGQKEIFKKLNKGNKLYLSDIKVQGPDGAIRDLAPLIFTVTD